MDELYMNIKKRRKEIGMTQKELAEKCGYTDHTTINKIENGLVDVTFKRTASSSGILQRIWSSRKDSTRSSAC